jgi:hypothetical protein
VKTNAKPKILYMIRDRNTGMYSPGGAWALDAWRAGRWSGKGKCWTSLGALKNHLRLFVNERYQYLGMGRSQRLPHENNIPAEWEVLSVEVKYEPVSNDSISARAMMPGA